MNTSNIVLVGFMGTGKTTVGIELAKRLEWAFVDTDQLIVEEAGMSIPDMFARYGQSYFRDTEERIVARIMQGERQVISTGGGAVLRTANREAMLRGGLVVALTATVETIAERVSQDTNRPLLAGNPLQNIQRLMEERKDAYRFAHVAVDTDPLSANEIVERILALYKEKLSSSH